MTDGISPTIYLAVDVLRKTFGGTVVEIVGTKMYRKSPNKFAKLGYLGVDIKVNGIPTFLGCESMAEEILGPYGFSIAEQFVYRVMDNMPSPNFKHINNERKKTK